jgi:hypothetical protein
MERNPRRALAGRLLALAAAGLIGCSGAQEAMPRGPALVFFYTPG